ncbi:MAG TPA: M1 family aminopeptidase [Myxococcales bacterium]|nr:M1 family aminopeptidase [Myxococcales bacterium]
MIEGCGGRLPSFDVRNEGPHPAADTRLRMRHLRLELRLDLEARRVEGRAILTLHAATPGVREAVFDAVELEIARIRVGGVEAPFHAGERQLRVELPRSPAPGVPFDVEIDYAATPRFGLFFLGPDAAYPDRPRQVWSQGQDDYSRYWYPCLDAPNQKATSELAVDVPAALTVVSNGRLVGRQELAAGRARWHFEHGTPHSPYLVCLVAGEFESWREEQGGVELSWHVPKGRAAEGHRSFDRTPEMIRFFADYTGQPYPYPKYSQTCVADFIFGGMENTSATTLTDRTLHDERAHLDFSSEPLVAHELAHQWFGDLLTCRSWSHGWLNEGFATYFEHLWTEHSQGRDELDAELAATADGYLDEDASRYRRPIVESRYHSPSDLFDRHLYNKGAWVLHMLRGELGDEGFRASLREYVAANRHGTVETVDLARAVERATGRNLDPFFDQWVFRAGHPELDVSLEPRAGSVRVAVVQKGEPFRLRLELRAAGPGFDRALVLPVGGKESVFDVAVPAPPRWVALDPEGRLLYAGEVKKPLELWLAELREGPTAVSRGRAARALGRAVAVPALQGLRAALLGDPFWWVQAQAAAALGEIRGPAALAALGEGLGVSHPKARRAVVRALGAFREARAAELLKEAAARDASYFVEGEALKALARTRAPGTREAVVAALPRESWQATVRALALDGLGEARDPEALPAVLQRLTYGEPVPARVAAVRALGKLGEGRREIADRIVELLEDPDFYVRLAACEAAVEANVAVARPALERLLRRDPSGRVQRAALEALARLGSDEPAPWRRELDSVRAELIGLRQEVAALRGR